MTREASPPLHGGDLDAATRRYGAPAEGWLDLSTGINPVGYPIPPMEPAVWHRLPRRLDEDALIAAARTYYGAPREATVVPAPGTQALIQLLPAIRPAGRVAVLGPTYAEHAHCWRALGHDVTVLAGDDAPPRDSDICVAVNPNNPDGRVWRHDDLNRMRQELARRDGWLVIDEAFADVVPEASLVDLAGAPGLVVLRSVGKFFGLAGLRLGFALTDAAVASALRRRLGPWAVAGPALWLGAAALADRRWIDSTRARLRRDAARLDRLLRAAGLEVVGGTPLFRLIRTGAASALQDHLARHGIWTRSFAEDPSWLRLGIPNEAGFDRLERALAAIPAAIAG